jgi:hypothetical protein
MFVELSCTQEFVRPAVFVPHALPVPEEGQLWVHQFPAPHLPCMQSAFVEHGSPSIPPDLEQMKLVPPMIRSQNVSVYGAQSLAVVQPGKQTNALCAFSTQKFTCPVLLIPHEVSVAEAHDLVHHTPLQLAGDVHAVHSFGFALLHGSPTLPLVRLQMNSLLGPLTAAWHVVPAYGVQSVFVVQPGKQMNALFAFSTQKFVCPTLFDPQLVSVLDVHD